MGLRYSAVPGDGVNIPLALIVAVGRPAEVDSMATDNNEMLDIGIVCKSSCWKLGGWVRHADRVDDTDRSPEENPT